MALLLGFGPSTVDAADLVKAKDGSGVYGYKDTPKLPWCEWLVHDPDRPAPLRVAPGPAGPGAPVPADAIVLFSPGDEKLSMWNPAPKWHGADGCMVAGEGALTTKEAFGDIQLHLEWMTPPNFVGSWADQGNNGVLLMGLYEIQIFDSHKEKLYPDGQCGAIYGQTPPLVNACRPAGEWQCFDILFSAPQFEGQKLLAPARVTVLHNGLVAQWNEPIHGETGHRIVPRYARKASEGPIALGGHNCPVRFRSIWVRRLTAGH